MICYLTTWYIYIYLMQTVSSDQPPSRIVSPQPLLEAPQWSTWADLGLLNRICRGISILHPVELLDLVWYQKIHPVIHLPKKYFYDLVCLLVMFSLQTYFHMLSRRCIGCRPRPALQILRPSEAQLPRLPLARLAPLARLTLLTLLATEGVAGRTSLVHGDINGWWIIWLVKASENESGLPLLY